MIFFGVVQVTGCDYQFTLGDRGRGLVERLEFEIPTQLGVGTHHSTGINLSSPTNESDSASLISVLQASTESDKRATVVTADREITGVPSTASFSDALGRGQFAVYFTATFGSPR